jgi:hypothetical protein
LIFSKIARLAHRTNYTKSADKKNVHWTLKAESEGVMTPIPALISEDLWNECNEFLTAQKKSGKRLTKQVAHLFAGFV